MSVNPRTKTSLAIRRTQTGERSVAHASVECVFSSFARSSSGLCLIMTNRRTT